MHEAVVALHSCAFCTLLSRLYLSFCSKPLAFVFQISVVGGYYDEEFKEDTTKLFERLKTMK